MGQEEREYGCNATRDSIGTNHLIHSMWAHSSQHRIPVKFRLDDYVTALEFDSWIQ